MRFRRDTRYRAGGFYICSVKERIRHRARYDSLDGPAYNRLLLRHRRTKALARIRKRHRPGED